jgi:hypothetical protein
MSRCPHLSERAHRELAPRIAHQQQKGIYVRREKEDIARQVAENLLALDFREAAERVGGRFLQHEGEDAVRIPFLGTDHIITRSGRVIRKGRHKPQPYEKILLYNHLIRSLGTRPKGRWVTIEALPGALTKAKDLEEALEGRIASACEKLGTEAISEAFIRAGGRPLEEKGDATVGFSFSGLPRVPLLILLWEGDGDFPARVRLLMDESVPDHLDADSLIVLAGFLGDRILKEASELK